MTINMEIVQFSFSVAIFSHYFRSAKTQVIGIRLEIKVNEKVTKTIHSQTPINSVNIYVMIKTIGSLHILCSFGQKILHQALGQHPDVNTTCGCATGRPNAVPSIKETPL